MRVVTLEAELINVKAAHTRLADVAARVEKEANKAQQDLSDLQVRFSEVVGGGADVPIESLEDVQQQSVKQAKPAEEASYQLTELSGRAQTIEAVVNSLRAQSDKVSNAHCDTTSSAHEKG